MPVKPQPSKPFKKGDTLIVVNKSGPDYFNTYKVNEFYIFDRYNSTGDDLLFVKNHPRWNDVFFTKDFRLATKEDIQRNNFNNRLQETIK